MARAERGPHRGRRHPPHQPLEGPGDHRPRPLQGHRERDGGPGAGQPHLRPARARGRRGREMQHPDHERRARVPAPSAGAPRQLALLVRPQDGREVGALHHLQALPPHPGPRLLPLLGRLLEVRRAAGAHQLHRRRKQDLVGHPPPRLLQDARVPRLRHPPRAEETVAIAALCQGLVAKLHRLYESTWASASTRARSSWRTSSAR